MTPNTEVKNEAASCFATEYGNATLTLYSDSDVALVTHTLSGFGEPVDGLLTANQIPEATVNLSAGTGTDISYGELASGSNIYTLTVTETGGGGDIIIDSDSGLELVANGVSTITSLTVQF